ncbi:unnamed protein product [Peronospora belbahrii]|uniref:PSP1 C-terminal domain-containing protein n=1 Tax=Peronospora belbahrii TaxID=622444 RepID=A0AAU9KX66_9STRA|nr:unnamed protein product [Peronospora belbahrii]
MTHLRCPRESGTVSAVPAIKSSEVDPIHLFYCSQHDGKTAKCPTSSSDASNSLRLRLAAGDVVLVLEFNNALLPQSAKMVAPDAANLWGVVVSAEEMEPRGRGNQLLKVRMFADDNVLAVPNQYAVRIAAASDFSRPVDLIRHCLQRHAMVELQLRRTDGKIDDVEAKRILFVSYKSFAARLKALRVTAAQALSYAEEGLARWRRFHDLAEPHHYDGLGDSAPIYFYIDTRGSRFGQQVLNSMDTVDNVAEAVRDVNEDVSVTGADTDSGGAAANGLARGSPHLHRRPYSVGRSPHEAEAEQLMKADAILSDTHLTHCSLPKQSQNKALNIHH